MYNFIPNTFDFYTYFLTYTHKVWNFERSLDLKDPVLLSSLQCFDSVVKVSYVFQMRPVFVQSGFEYV